MTKQHPSLCRGGACRSEAEILSERSESKGPLPLGACVLLALLLAAPPAARAADWPPISPEELALKDDPLRPGAPAIFLYREVEIDNAKAYQRYFYRIKILREEGRKQADIEIPFVKNVLKLEDLQARVIYPDGRVVPFKGQVRERTVLKAGGARLLAKTFNLPDVQVGTSIEYQYTLRWEIFPALGAFPFLIRWFLPAPRFDLQEKLSTLRAHFLYVSGYAGDVPWVSFVPSEKGVPKRTKKGRVELEVTNIPAFEEEDYMPPWDEDKMRVLFVASNRDPQEAQKHWTELGKG